MSRIKAAYKVKTITNYMYTNSRWENIVQSSLNSGAKLHTAQKENRGFDSRRELDARSARETGIGEIGIADGREFGCLLRAIRERDKPYKRALSPECFAPFSTASTAAVTALRPRLETSMNPYENTRCCGTTGRKLATIRSHFCPGPKRCQFISPTHATLPLFYWSSSLRRFVFKYVHGTLESDVQHV